MSELDIGATLRALHQGDVAFVLIGGVAVAAHGHVRGTEAVDLVPDPDPDRENLLRLGNVLATLDAHRLLGDGAAFGPEDHDALAAHQNLSVVTCFGPLDVVQRVPGLPPYAELEARAVTVEAFGVPLRVISKADLISAKRARSEPRDLDDINALEA